MAETKKSLPVPGGRLNRMARLGGLAGSVMGGMVTEGLNHARQGKMPSVSDLMLTPRNVRKVSKQLSELRGAAMKVGQLLSMDSGDLLPEELSEILSLLRADANPIPMSQVVAILNREWGEQWQEHFSRFSFQPMAAASIGQVHHAETKDNVRVAVKLQYPGVSDSIDSDIDNVAMLFRLSRLLPEEVDIRELLNEAKIQLKLETDYIQEAENILRFQNLLAADERFRVPDVINELTTQHILSMTFEDAVPLDHVRTTSQESRDYVVDSIIQLVLREVFEFQFVQTDPNIANYLFNSDQRQVVLLDFGACRQYSDDIVTAYRNLLSSAIHDDREGMISAASAIGYFGEQISVEQVDIVIKLFSLVVEPARTNQPYDFSKSDLASRISELGMELSFRKNYWHTPPADALFFHRKLIGIYLLATRFGARVNVHQHMHQYLLDAVQR
jgi:predicted unusual protein kinase regulating ubiquinone biosynthesis (AarF/ABC1/UbiB family)